MASPEPLSSLKVGPQVRIRLSVHALVKDRHRSREFIEFLNVLDTAYPAATAIKVILDNHSAHISRETKTWLAAQPDGRCAFVFTPKHGSPCQLDTRIEATHHRIHQ